jgi:hypothetical protein
MSTHDATPRSRTPLLRLVTGDEAPPAPQPSAGDAVLPELAAATGVRPVRGPRPVVDLDGVPRGQWRTEPETLYAWNGRLWRKELVGCVLCVQADAAGHLTMSTIDGPTTTFVCTEHGELCEVPYSMTKRYTVRIGDVLREGEESLEDTMLFPIEMTITARNALIERLLDEAAAAERDSGPAPSE